MSHSVESVLISTLTLVGSVAIAALLLAVSYRLVPRRGPHWRWRGVICGLTACVPMIVVLLWVIS